MNKQNENGIRWCDFTWNPVSGCLHNCLYCYVPQSKRFENDPMKPEFHTKRLHEKMPKKSSRIFTGSTADMWGEWVPEAWIKPVLKIVEEYSQHRYIFLTKHPIRYSDFTIPDNAWCGTSIEGQDKSGRVDDLLWSAPTDRAFLSLEPLIEAPGFIYNQNAKDLKWIIIGGLTGSRPRIPDPNWIDLVLDFAELNSIPVFIKHNARYPRKIKEYPSDLLFK